MRGMSEAEDKILIITSLNISVFIWSSETILFTNIIPFLPEPSETHCFFPLDQKKKKNDMMLHRFFYLVKQLIIQILSFVLVYAMSEKAP